MPSIIPPTRTAPPPAPHPLKREAGWASWYGLELDGELTASGEPYDMNALTAAHRSLPLGTTVRVTNLRNKRSVLVRINDRGPSLSHRLIDVSWAAAQHLGFVSAGLTRVTIQIVQYPHGLVPSTTAITPTAD